MVNDAPRWGDYLTFERGAAGAEALLLEVGGLAWPARFWIADDVLWHEYLRFYDGPLAWGDFCDLDPDLAGGDPIDKSIDLRSPFPYAGGKSRAAKMVWERLGDTKNYVEPFLGSGAMLLARPYPARTETVNDADPFLSNFWRALKLDPDGVAEHADFPVSEPDLRARHLWLVTEGWKRVAACFTDPDHYDAKAAGYWVWGICQWIGGGWCSAQGATWNKIPMLSCSRGVQRTTLGVKKPHLSTGGMGIHRTTLSNQIPALGSGGMGILRETNPPILDYLRGLAQRLRRVRACSGDWSRVLTRAVTTGIGLTAVFLDPPYAESEYAKGTYATETPGVAKLVREWCAAHGDDPKLRICLCGYRGEGHEALEALGWTAVGWATSGGYSNQGKKVGLRGKVNSKRETLWFSPHCLVPEAPRG